ncbi:CPBP family intramembrane glutamic endopeptidase [Thermomonas hydrothermalis]|uniref:CAAX prenyl protease 2/Lysostaphin resistance protein A-like domain-containing protein n=1 Tax=Thermomonas hydrothermalis TaxID=213588 RepID=A0A1M4W9B0_9GAMM|nr:CPBP family intramembrane glutamic endopeptidase [Thermomonas hydrothermalis]MCL6619518.1 CPBP family intramembrane metalloprotease [Thermomonas hydrothermalis]SHE77552.1 hypothetical protein SAMN02745204_01127 [Thermomonas hydrothermalis]
MDTPRSARSTARSALGFVLLLLLYQSAEGIGDRMLHSFFAQAGLMLACVLAAWPVSRWLGYRGLEAFALPMRGRDLIWLVLLLVLAFGLKGAALQAGLTLGIYQPDPAGTAPGSTLTALPMLLLSTFVPSIAEDILTRGFPYRAAGVHWRRGLAFVATSSLLYVLNHLYRLGLGPMEWLMLLVYGLAYASALWRTGSLWAAVGLHWGWNLGNAALAVAMPTSTTDVDGGRLLSMAAHLLMLAVVLIATRRVAPAR